MDNGDRIVPPQARTLIRLVVTRAAIKRLAVFGILLAAFLCWCWWSMIRMPGENYRGPLEPLSAVDVPLRDALAADVAVLATEIGDRNVFKYDAYMRAAGFIEAQLAAAGYAVERQAFDAGGRTCVNLAAERPGSARAAEIVVVGAHYDSVPGCPAANDNGSGVAATLALARSFAASAPARTLRFVLFANEEPPHFQSAEMGSLVYARRCRARGENVVAMLSLETIGCYSDEPGSQRYPAPFGLLYPTTGDFIGFVGNYASRRLVRQAIGTFRRHARFPSEGAAVPSFVAGVGWSDHWAFWQEGYCALMVTDTAPFRYLHYHEPSDTPDKLDFDRMARVVRGLRFVVDDLANPTPKE